MKITIEGEIDLEQFARILSVMSIGLGPAISFVPKDINSGEVKGNFTIPKDYTGPGPDTSGTEGLSGQAEIKTRTRRTKAEIEAADANKASLNAVAVNEIKAELKPPVNGNAIDFEELKRFAQEKAQKEENVPKIKAKLAEFGVKKTKELEARPETHNPYWVFLQAL